MSPIVVSTTTDILADWNAYKKINTEILFKEKSFNHIKNVQFLNITELNLVAPPIWFTPETVRTTGHRTCAYLVTQYSALNFLGYD